MFMSSWSVQGCVRTSQGYTDTCSCPVGLYKIVCGLVRATQIHVHVQLVCDKIVCGLVRATEIHVHIQLVCDKVM